MKPELVWPPPESYGVVDGAFPLDGIHDVDEFALHGLERDILVGLDGADEPPRVLLRKESFRNDHIQRRSYIRNLTSRMSIMKGACETRPAERGTQGVEYPFAGAIESAGVSTTPIPQQARAHHRRARERNHQGDD